MTEGRAESIGMDAARLERSGPAMQAYADRVSTIVARRGIVVREGRYGLRDREAGLPMTEDKIFRLYSMTKPIVCTALMTLFEGGRFRLIDPVARYVPSFAGLKVLQADRTLAESNSSPACCGVAIAPRAKRPSTGSIDSAAATADPNGRLRVQTPDFAPIIGVRPMKPRRWRSPPR